ncbi:MAG TPA: DUF4440 domain-containing protein [Longimicrobiaceae bacterium]|nr:DUF4440 domain-containing protein [Longimicrobiaceae bacterium]
MPARFFPALALACSLAVLPGVAAAQTSRAAVDSVFTAVYARFSEGYRRADAAMVAALYADSAFYLEPGSRIKQGNDAILQTFQAFLGPFAQRGEGLEVRFDIIDRDVSGGLAYDIGYYTIGAKAEPDGKFIVIWKRGADGEWRIHADGYSGVMAMRRPQQPGGGVQP